MQENGPHEHARNEGQNQSVHSYSLISVFVTFLMDGSVDIIVYIKGTEKDPHQTAWMNAYGTRPVFLHCASNGIPITVRRPAKHPDGRNL